MIEYILILLQYELEIKLIQTASIRIPPEFFRGTLGFRLKFFRKIERSTKILH